MRGTVSQIINKDSSLHLAFNTIIPNSTICHSVPAPSLPSFPPLLELILNVLSASSFRSQGVFVQLVQANSPAALAGLRFGDQVLQINGQNCAGWTVDKAHKALKAAAETRIELVVRDR